MAKREKAAPEAGDEGAQSGAVATVRMVLDRETNPGKAAYEADVHPDEVENMKAHGWQVSK